MNSPQPSNRPLYRRKTMLPLTPQNAVSRREFLRTTSTLAASAFATAAVSALSPAARAADAWAPRYVLASSLFGKLPLREILPAVSQCGAEAIDLWPKPHGSQREELDSMGMDAFKQLLSEHKVQVGVLTRYDLGMGKLVSEFDVARALGARVIVTGVGGPKGLAGAELKAAVGDFAQKIAPVVAVAEEKGITIAMENHGNCLLETADSVRYLVDACRSKALGIALAPYHLEQDPEALARLVRELGPRLAVFYAWQHGKGAMGAQPKADELLQLPGRGPLDFRPAMRALRDMNYQGITQIFMHPFPRGIPILPTVAECVTELNLARTHLQSLLA